MKTVLQIEGWQKIMLTRIAQKIAKQKVDHAAEQAKDFAEFIDGKMFFKKPYQ